MVAGPERQKQSHTHGSGRILTIFLVFTHNRMIAEGGNYCIDHGCIDPILCAELAESHSRRLCLCTQPGSVGWAYPWDSSAEWFRCCREEYCKFELPSLMCVNIIIL